MKEEEQCKAIRVIGNLGFVCQSTKHDLKESPHVYSSEDDMLHINWWNE